MFGGTTEKLEDSHIFLAVYSKGLVISFGLQHQGYIFKSVIYTSSKNFHIKFTLLRSSEACSMQ
jgi:hypothetical protein